MTAEKKRTTNDNGSKKICDAALKLAAAHGWHAVTLEQIAKAAKMPLPQLQKMFADKNAILPTIVHMIDAETADSIGKPDMKMTPHDRLFEVMMARFDHLQTHRAAILNIMADVKRDPRMVRFLVPAQGQAMRHMLALAGLKAEGPKRHVVAAGLGVIYGLALCAWRSDESQDMAKTMAVLDRSLKHAGRIAEFILPSA